MSSAKLTQSVINMLVKVVNLHFAFRTNCEDNTAYYRYNFVCKLSRKILTRLLPDGVVPSEIKKTNKFIISNLQLIRKQQNAVDLRGPA